MQHVVEPREVKADAPSTRRASGSSADIQPQLMFFISLSTSCQDHHPMAPSSSCQSDGFARTS